MADRRRYPRIQADVLYRPAGLALMHHRRNTQDISLGGMRVYSDERLPVGSRFDLDILLADGSVVRCWAEVVWIIEPMPGGAGSFEIGLKFTDLAPQDVQRLATVLSSAV